MKLFHLSFVIYFRLIKSFSPKMAICRNHAHNNPKFTESTESKLDSSFYCSCSKAITCMQGSELMGRIRPFGLFFEKTNKDVLTRISSYESESQKHFVKIQLFHISKPLSNLHHAFTCIFFFSIHHLLCGCCVASLTSHAYSESRLNSFFITNKSVCST